MEYYLLCAGIFAVAYAINATYISVFYHRGLTHGAVTLSPLVRKFVVASGPWVMGIDAKTWCTMHRLHHRHSDAEQDPHSPLNSSIPRVIVEQLKSYERIMRGLAVGKRQYTSEVPDLDFQVHWLYRKKLWWVPYALHLAISVALSFAFGGWLIGLAFYSGMVTHPIQGWMVNAFGHSMGYQTFDNQDNSKNNNIVSWLVMGEGYQNNHHKHPRSPKFSYRWFEVDYGYTICQALQLLGVLKIEKEHIIHIAEKREETLAALEGPAQVVS